MFPYLRTLWYCNASKPAIDKFDYLAHRTTTEIDKSCSMLNESSHFVQSDDDEDNGELELENGDEIFSTKKKGSVNNK